jgi:hypothetical protein
MQKQETAAEVIGAGVLLDGSNVYIVSSQSEDGRSHIERQEATRLVCDCRGYHYRGRCAHVAEVVAHKTALELARANAEAIIADAGLSRGTPAPAPARPAASASAGAAKMAAYRQSSHPGDTALPRRNNQPFSIWR